MTNAIDLHIINATLLHMKRVKNNHNCIDELRQVALKATPARLEALNVLEHTNMPLDVASLKSELKKRGVNADPATVFRMMNAFEEKGLITAVHLQENKSRYEYAGKENHHHFICENCGLISDITDCQIGSIEKKLRLKKGFMIKRHSLEFFGLCKKCQN